MDARAPLANNTDLWLAYLTEQRQQWLDAWRLQPASVFDEAITAWTETTAAAVARALESSVALGIEAMFRANAPSVTESISSTRTEVPEAYRKVEEHVQAATSADASAVGGTPPGDTQGEDLVMVETGEI